ncbi:MAG: hypothetical protein NTZ69_10490 [Bacteroidia bacterium]|nr:hypothetical protein [Bacteroidia bacterium]
MRKRNTRGAKVPDRGRIVLSNLSSRTNNPKIVKTGERMITNALCIGKH